jgi:hypothetical protein
MEVTDETDRDDAGDPEDAICRGLYEMYGEEVDPRASGRDLGGFRTDVSAVRGTLC